MANRVLLNSSGLKVSRAGVNVLTASNLQLLFDSNWSQITPFIRSQWSIPGNSNQFFAFGRSFVNLPMVVISGPPVLGGRVQFINSFQLWQGTFNWVETAFWAEVVSNGVHMRSNSGATTFQLTIWDFDL